MLHHRTPSLLRDTVQIQRRIIQQPQPSHQFIRYQHHLQHVRIRRSTSYRPYTYCKQSIPFHLGNQSYRRSSSLTTSSRLQQLRERLQNEHTSNNSMVGNNSLPSSPGKINSFPSHHPSVVVPKNTNLQGILRNDTSQTPYTDTVPFTHPLQDRFGRRHRYLRISLTERCNLRCTYCMPEEGIELSPSVHLLTTTELYQLSSLFVSLGIDKIRLTGGEPTLRKDLETIIDYLAHLEGLRTIAITTNGITLAKNLSTYIQKGLNQINISLDTLKPHRFEQLSRRPPQMWNRVMDSIYASIDAYKNAVPRPKNSFSDTNGNISSSSSIFSSSSSHSSRLSTIANQSKGLKQPLKINTVIIRNVNDDEINDFVQLTLQYPIQVRFIEFMPFPGNHYKKESTVGWKELLSNIQAKYPDIQPYISPSSPSSSTLSETAKLYTVPHAPGQFGFISTMTDIFCNTCDRLRLTADGNIRTCLHGEAEYSLRDVLRHHSSSLPNRPNVEKDNYSNSDSIDSSKYTLLPMASDTLLYEQLCNVIGTAVQRKHAALGGNKTPEALIARIQQLSTTDSDVSLTNIPQRVTDTKNTNGITERNGNASTLNGQSIDGTKKEKNNSSVPQHVQQYRPMIKIGG